MYQKIKERVSHGARFSVDFKERTLRMDGKLVDLNEPLGIETYPNLDEWLDKVEDLYDDYKYSRPSVNSMNKARKAKFKALTVDELVAECGHDALNNPLGRDEAQAALEVFILFSIIQNPSLVDELFAKDWFYQGSDKQLIIRKDWFYGKNGIGD